MIEQNTNQNQKITEDKKVNRLRRLAAGVSLALLGTGAAMNLLPENTAPERPTAESEQPVRPAANQKEIATSTTSTTVIEQPPMTLEQATEYESVSGSLRSYASDLASMVRNSGVEPQRSTSEDGSTLEKFGFADKAGTSLHVTITGHEGATDSITIQTVSVDGDSTEVFREYSVSGASFASSEGTIIDGQKTIGKTESYTLQGSDIVREISGDPNEVTATAEKLPISAYGDAIASVQNPVNEIYSQFGIGA